jgi:hypothetical protein
MTPRGVNWPDCRPLPAVGWRSGPQNIWAGPKFLWAPDIPEIWKGSTMNKHAKTSMTVEEALEHAIAESGSGPTWRGLPQADTAPDLMNRGPGKRVQRGAPFVWPSNYPQPAIAGSKR